MDDGTVSREELDSIGSEIEAIIDAAVQFAEESPFPEPDALYDDVYGGM